ncbi:hypothetical protein Emin_0004 [Elusimicrobium minutum Pei191]|uniref:DUF721 domain-containing protein n=1 Tax=Elusimicrobium minutum (strain Pei191) TaxID=445932 RepID=B2KAM6_ELUMP|nr:DciA family protein [Elusimicrobium minutum]ACC97572.1 hypothetical protein Emin_0004 [Elusimicrobium minutum Pei191]
MKLGAKPRKIWNSSGDLNNNFNPLAFKLNRLMVLGMVWEKLAGKRAKFWILDAASKDAVFIKVKNSSAKLELAGHKENLIKELNKHFDKPWIKKIEIV